MFCLHLALLLVADAEVLLRLFVLDLQLGVVFGCFLECVYVEALEVGKLIDHLVIALLRLLHVVLEFGVLLAEESVLDLYLLHRLLGPVLPCLCEPQHVCEWLLLLANHVFFRDCTSAKLLNRRIQPILEVALHELADGPNLQTFLAIKYLIQVVLKL